MPLTAVGSKVDGKVPRELEQEMHTPNQADSNSFKAFAETWGRKQKDFLAKHAGKVIRHLP